VAKAGNTAGRIGSWAFVLLVATGAASAAEPSQKPLIDAFVAHTGLPRGWVVAVKPEIVVAIRDRDALKPGEGGQKVRLQGEAADEEMADRLGYRSMRSAVEINCETRRDRVVEMEVFPQHDLKGPGQKRAVPGGWVQPSEDAYLADVIRTVCRAPRAVQAQAQTDAEAPQLRPTLSATAKPSPHPAPAVLAKATPPAPPAAPAKVETPRLMTLVTAAAPVATPTAAGALQAQVGALDTEADARRALDKLALPSGISTRIETATVGGRIYYRAVVAGFATPAQAKAFCAEQRRRAAPCMIR
jgi:cell division protein FtsN